VGFVTNRKIERENIVFFPFFSAFFLPPPSFVSFPSPPYNQIPSKKNNKNTKKVHNQIHAEEEVSSSTVSHLIERSELGSLTFFQALCVCLSLEWSLFPSSKKLVVEALARKYGRNGRVFNR
jgi:hypothetical protein